MNKRLEEIAREREEIKQQMSELTSKLHKLHKEWKIIRRQIREQQD